MMTKPAPLRIGRAILLVAGLSLSGLPALAAAPTDVLATVDGEQITQRDLDIAIEDLGQSLQGVPPEQQGTYVLGYLIDLKLLANQAEKDKLAEGEEFGRRIAYLRDKALMESFLGAQGKQAASDEAMRKVYDETVKTVKPETEVRARHVLTETEDQAKEALAKIKAGTDFAVVAKEASKDPGSAESGGELGFFSKDQMVPPFADAAFKLEPGQISEPVKSDFGWHVIQVEEKREKPVPTFDEVKPQIAQYLTRRTQQETILKLRDAAKIERTDKAPPAPAAAPGSPAPAQP